MFGLFGSGYTVNVKGKKLISYKCSRSGDMTGGHDSTEVYIDGDETYIRHSSSECWNEDAAVVRYKADKAVLKEIEAVFRKYKMNRWHGKKFTRIFVADGASTSYDFRFDDGKNVRFSSQLYPDIYRNKLKRIDEVINDFRNKAVAEPTIVVDISQEKE